MEWEFRIPGFILIIISLVVRTTTNWHLYGGGIAEAGQDCLFVFLQGNGGGGGGSAALWYRRHLRI